MSNRHRLMLQATATTMVIAALLCPQLQAEDEEEYATLLISADTPCVLLVDDVVTCRLDPDVTTEMRVEPGYRNLTALSLLALGVRWDEVLDAEEDALYAHEVELAEVVALEFMLDTDPLEILLPEPDRRLEDQGNGVVYDIDTDLYWTQLDSAVATDWDAAHHYCTTLLLGIEDVAAPQRPWRLPTLDELETLVDMQSFNELGILQGIRLSGCCPWSAEQYGTISAWYLSFENGRRGFVAHYYDIGGRALCVR